MVEQALTVTNNSFEVSSNIGGTMWVGDSYPNAGIGTVFNGWVPTIYPMLPQNHYHYIEPFYTYPNDEIFEKARKYDAIMKKHPKLKLEEKKAEIKALAKQLGVKIKFA